MRLLFALALLTAHPTSAQVRNDTFRVLTIHTPPEIARADTVLGQNPCWGGQPPDAGLTARLVHVVDTDGDHFACAPIANVAEVEGQLALIERGLCEFELKALNAQAAGAAAFVVYQDDRVPDGNCDTVWMSNPLCGGPVVIPGAFLPRCVISAFLRTVLAGTEIVATLAPYVEALPATEPGAGSVGAAVAVSPNPAGGDAHARLSLRSAGRVRVAVYDLLGREAVVLHEGPLGAGVHALPVGVTLAPGVYVMRVQGPGVSASRTFTLGR